MGQSINLENPYTEWINDDNFEVKGMQDETLVKLHTRIEDYRDEINEIDDKILSLLSRRQGLARELGRAKRVRGIRLPDIHNEHESIKRLISGNHQNLDDKDVRNIFTEILSASRSIHHKLIIVFR